MISSTPNINNLLEIISHLDYDEKITMMESIIRMIKKESGVSTPTIKRKLSDLKGLGAEIWKDTDVEKYLQNERRWE